LLSTFFRHVSFTIALNSTESGTRDSEATVQQETVEKKVTTWATRNTDMTKLFARFVKDESGATAIEYGLIAALIAIAIIGGARWVGSSVNTKFTQVGTALDAVTPATGTGQ
jgi:pilus assembly protein Flp/PilA